MGIIKKQGGTSTLLIYFGVLLGYINAAVLLPKYFSPEIIGIRTLLIDYSTILLQFSLFGFHNVIQRYAPKFKNSKDQTPGLLFLVLVIPMLLFALVSLLFNWQEENFISLYAKNAKEFTDYLHLLLPLSFVLLLISIFETYIKSFYKIAIPVFLREVFLRLTFTITIVFYIFGDLSLQDFFRLFVSTYYINCLILLLYIVLSGKLDLTPTPKRYTKKLMSGIGAYAGFTFLMGVTTFLVTKIDSFMIGSMIGTKEVGIYTIGVFVATLVEIPRRGIRQISLPLVAELWNKKEFDSLKELHHKVSMAQIAIGFFVFIAIYINIQDIYALIPNGHLYASGLWVVVFISLGRISEMAFGVNNEIMLFSDKYKYNLVFSITFGILAISSNYILIPLYGISGAAIASFGSVAVINIAKFLFVKHQLTLSPFRPKSIILLLWIGVNVLIFNSFGNFNLAPFLNILLKGGLFSLLYFSGIYAFKFLPDFNSFIDQQLIKIGIKGK